MRFSGRSTPRGQKLGRHLKGGGATPRPAEAKSLIGRNMKTRQATDMPAPGKIGSY